MGGKFRGWVANSAARTRLLLYGSTLGSKPDIRQKLKGRHALSKGVYNVQAKKYKNILKGSVCVSADGSWRAGAGFLCIHDSPTVRVSLHKPTTP